ncbi:MAG: ComF family protein [Actinophytocola sp.]|uniref:ComF family protein n=1 Tax=Actinophytocola sp. TaxID=1872138 RepID=UPI00132979A0|nr:ComF family protein [Actinophytocola sp.]MPZ79087.1 ComF family protein [Actinophytocola sp.]
MRSFRLVDLILPQRCAGCAAPLAAWCPTCARSLGAPVSVARPGLPVAYALGDYRGPARRAVLAYKERGRRELAGHLGGALAAALPSIRAGPMVLVPAPSRPAAARARGGQHMTVVARHCAAVLRAGGRWAAVVPALRLDHRAADSVGLDAEERAANLLGRLRPDPRHPPPAGVPVVLVDDVITTGATATACVSALRSVGVPVAAVVALTAAG